MPEVNFFWKDPEGGKLYLFARADLAAVPRQGETVGHRRKRLQVLLNWTVRWGDEGTSHDGLLMDIQPTTPWIEDFERFAHEFPFAF